MSKIESNTMVEKGRIFISKKSCKRKKKKGVGQDLFRLRADDNFNGKEKGTNVLNSHLTRPNSI